MSRFYNFWLFMAGSVSFWDWKYVPQKQISDFFKKAHNYSQLFLTSRWLMHYPCLWKFTRSIPRNLKTINSTYLDKLIHMILKFHHPSNWNPNCDSWMDLKWQFTKHDSSTMHKIYILLRSMNVRQTTVIITAEPKALWTKFYNSYCSLQWPFWYLIHVS
jgi:hypothetical protein